MRPTNSLLALPFTAVLVLASFTLTAPAAEPAVADTPSQASIKMWIEQLNNDDFRIRSAASQKLLNAGDAAIEAVTAAAKSPHAEVALRASAILKKLAKPKITTTASGLKYRIVKASKEKKPGPTSKVTVHYSGWLDDGTEFDSSLKRGQPATFPLTGVIKGWTEGLQLIGRGGVIELEIPPKLGYGERGAGRIPAGATLHFRVELIDIK